MSESKRKITVVAYLAGRPRRMNTEDKWRDAISSRLLTRSDFVNIQFEDDTRIESRAEDVPELAAIFLELFPGAPVTAPDAEGEIQPETAHAVVTQIAEAPETGGSPGPERFADLMPAYAVIVAARASDCEAFLRRYDVRGVEKTSTPGQFALSADGTASVWAVPLEGHPSATWLLLPGRDAIRAWSYLAAMNGSGAAERLNTAYEFVPDGDETLRILNPALASSQDGKLFQVVATGKLAGTQRVQKRVANAPAAANPAPATPAQSVAQAARRTSHPVRNFFLIGLGIVVVITVLARSCSVTPPPAPKPETTVATESSYTVQVETNLRSAPTVTYDTRVRSTDGKPITLAPSTTVTGTVETSATDPTSKWLKLTQGPYAGDYVWMGRLVPQ